MSKTAILQCPDQGPVESLAVMLRAVGYECYLPSEMLRNRLRSLFGGKGLVLSPRDLTARMGYDPVFAMPEAPVSLMASTDLYVDIKAHQVHDKIVKAWPNLKGKVLWYRINGAIPEHVVNANGDHGDEINPPCPVLTPNQWYATEGAWSDRSYAMWPPFVRIGDYYDTHGRHWNPDLAGRLAHPCCLIHGLHGWGYGALIDPMRQLGVRMYGVVAPDGLLQHGEVPELLSYAKCMVHLKSNDAPGYALYEALAAGCPVICTRRLIWRCRMESLLIPNETCLVFDRETHDALSPDDVQRCTAEVASHLERLSDPRENERIGMAGRERLREVMWSSERAEDVESLRAFMERHYGG